MNKETNKSAAVLMRILPLLQNPADARKLLVSNLYICI
jgi:hypothetical protein